MIRPLMIAAIIALLAASGSKAAPSCPIPLDLMIDDAELPATKATQTNHQKLRIVAFGAGSTLGQAAEDPALTYPARLQARLQAVLGSNPGVEVLNKGVPRDDLQQMLTRLSRDVIDQHPALVIWDVGTNDAAAGRDLDSFAADLESGIIRLKAAGIDVILMDMQYAPTTASIINFDPYLETLDRVADLDDVTNFHRFAIMREWSDDGVFSYNKTLPDERRELAREVYDCLAAGLSDGIATAIGR